jgi:uncharacterized protein involved in exopolysaccharide biosynthesis
MDELYEEDGTGLRDYLAALRRRWRTAVIGFVAVLAIGGAAAVLWPPVYRSTATILIEQQEIPQDLVRSTITSFADQRIQLINQRVMTTTNLLTIIREHGLYADDFDSKPREVIIDRMRKDIGMEMISADVVDPRSGQPTAATIAFTVSYSNRSPGLAAVVANELTSLYLQENSETRRQQAAEASAFLMNETERLRQDIAVFEGRLAEFKQSNVDRLPDLAGLNQSLLSRAEQDLSDVQRQRGVLDERRVYLEAELAQLSPNREVVSGSGDVVMAPEDRLRALEAYLASVSGVYTANHPDVVRTRSAIAALRAQLGGASTDTTTDLRAELEALRAEHASVLERYQPLHPDVVRLERRVAAAEARLAEAEAAAAAEPAEPSVERATNPAYVQLRAQLASDAVELAALVAKESELRERVNTLEERLLQTPSVERDFSALMRDLESARLKYQEVSAKQMEAVVAENLEMDSKAERFTLIEPPLLPERPVSPNRWLIVFLSLVLAIAASGFAVALRESLDDSVRGPGEFQRKFGLTPLGVIPAILTAEDMGLRRRRRVQTVAATAVTFVVVVVLAHLLVAPLDALWFAALRRFGV